ncbi:MAG: DNA topoisomerase III [Betaproteobacteria bacterium]|nr:DNA topoisomerase III [Betaproteobacteria bacterium]
MGKQLIIAEKPSVAGDIARALGGFTRHNNYYESSRYVLSYAVGHLLELSAPEEFDPKRGRWSFRHLPVIPPRFDLAPINGKSAAQLGVLLKLIRRKDVVRLINACDAGREGELIFRYIVQHARDRKPIERLWLQSMTPAAIREGFEQLRSDRQMLPLADAAKCRSEADWLVGINGTRAMTAFNSKEGGFYLTTVGRVQTPTLAILVEREERIRNFTPRDYWEVHARFGAKAGEYAGRWFNPDFRKADDPEKKSERLWRAPEADQVVAACRGKAGKVSEETKPATQLSPLLFDLTSLQRDANSRFGFSAKTTLSLAQALYERHKVLTYPRTDSRALPEDYLGTVKKTLSTLQGTPYSSFAGNILKQGWVRPNKRIFNNAKVSDHFAIIPTLQAPKHLNEMEGKLYDLVVRRFLAVFHPAAEYLQTLRITKVGEHRFKTEGRVLQNPGWLVVYGKSAQEESEGLPPVAQNEAVDVLDVAAVAHQTKPPARYTEATLLSAMEGAGKLVEDDELRAAMEAKGLGTPATRAAIIEGLLQEEYVHRNGKELVPTPKAFSLFFALRHFGVTEITSPELTGDWEFKLKQMEAGGLKREEFMEHIESVTRDLVERIRNGDIPDAAFATVRAPCPKCGGMVQENYRKFQCQKCDFSLWKVLSGREWAPEEIVELFSKHFVGPLTGFRSRAGKPFSAALRLTGEFRLEFDFGRGAPSADEGGAPDFGAQDPVGACPKCGARVFEHGAAYVCEKAVGAGRSCDFRSGKLILQQPIERAQMQKLLTAGRTDLLSGFISRRNGRKFKAFLVARPDGAVNFEFEAKTPRKPRAVGRPSAQEDAAKPMKRRAVSGRAARAKTPAKPRRKAA